jgi:hypothetical protein
MENNNLVLITTFIGSGITDDAFLNQRIDILKYSTIPSLLNQNHKNFVWLVYLDEFNNSQNKIMSLYNLFNKYLDEINIHIVKYKPFLEDGSLCKENRARSCSTKRYELYKKSVDYCKLKGYLKNIKYISHIMLDDDDPILPNHITWINKNVNTYQDKLNDSRGMIIINNKQYVFYINDLSLISVKSTKSLKGSCFVFYKIDNSHDIRFHPYSILESITGNVVYKTKYNIDYQVVEEPPSWIYFRHGLSTSPLSKSYIISAEYKKWSGLSNIIQRLPFYGNGNLVNLQKSLTTKKKSIELSRWMQFRNHDLKNILFIIDDLSKYETAIKLAVFLRHNFNIKCVIIDPIGSDNQYVKTHKDYFSKNTIIEELTPEKRVTKKIVDFVKSHNPSYTFVFANPKSYGRVIYYLKTTKIIHNFVDVENQNHKLFNTELKNIKFWNQYNFIDFYDLLITNLVIPRQLV